MAAAGGGALPYDPETGVVARTVSQRGRASYDAAEMSIARQLLRSAGAARADEVRAHITSHGQQGRRLTAALAANIFAAVGGPAAPAPRRRTRRVSRSPVHAPAAAGGGGGGRSSASNMRIKSTPSDPKPHSPRRPGSGSDPRQSGGKRRTRNRRRQ